MRVRRSRFPGLEDLSERRRQFVADLVATRRDLGLSQAELASRMGTSQAAVARLEAGQVDIRLSTMERYAAAVGHRLEWRLADRGTDRAPTEPAAQRPSRPPDPGGGHAPDEGVGQLAGLRRNQAVDPEAKQLPNPVAKQEGGAPR